MPPDQALILIFATQLALSVAFFALCLVPNKSKDKIGGFQLVERFLVFRDPKDLEEIKNRKIEYFLRQKELESIKHIINENV